MACVRSLGVHTPAALPYLVAESILREDATEDDYNWDTYSYEENGAVVEEELTWTQYCVVWSRGGVVQKVFNFEVEQQQVVQAVLTYFSRCEAASSHDPLEDGQLWRKHNQKPKGDERKGREPPEEEPNQEHHERALVVFLKLQAHVFFLAGSSHIVNLPFEVEKAFPIPKGLILQRKISVAGFIPPTPALPTAPPNSFFSSQQTFSQPSFRLSTSFNSSRKTKHSRSNTATGRFLDDLWKEANAPLNDDLPRFFSFTDPLSELGLVVDATPAASVSVSQRSYSERSLEPVDRAEELIYASKESELPCKRPQHDRPFVIVVTANHQSRTYSIWNVSLAASRSSISIKKRRESYLPISKTRRRSSYGPTPGTGTTTPGLRSGVGAGENFTGAARSKSNVASQELGASQTGGRRGQKSVEDEFASHIDPDYGMPGQPAKESRRVSSLLSRADLNTSFDKSAFQDLATHRTSLGASFGSQSRRGQSMGGYGDRPSLGRANHRASTPGSVSRLSLGTVSLDDTLDDTIADSSDDLSDDFGYGVFEPLRGLKREIMMTRISEFPFGESAPIFNTSFINPGKARLRVFTVAGSDISTSTQRARQSLFLHILDRPSRSHIQVELGAHIKKRAKRQSSITGAQQTIEPCDVFAPEVVKFDILQGHLDAIKLYDRNVQCVLCLSQSLSGEFQLSLHSERQSYLPLSLSISHLKLFNPYRLSNTLPAARKSAGLKRTLSAPRAIREFEAPGCNGVFDVVDGEGRRHRLQVQLCPTNPEVRKVFSLFRTIFPGQGSDLLLSIWWSLLREIQKGQFFDAEWTALASTIFTLPIHFVDTNSIPTNERSGQAAYSEKRRSGSTALSGSSVDADLAWALMWGHEQSKSMSRFWDSPSWRWTAEHMTPASQTERKRERGPLGGHLPTFNNHSVTTGNKNDFVRYSISIARQFLESPVGQAANDQWRRISTANVQDVRSIYIPQMLVALHLLREEDKLNALTQHADLNAKYLGPILAQLGHWLKWENWGWKRGSYYNLEGIDIENCSFEDSNMSIERTVPPPWERPPSIYEWVDMTLIRNSKEAFPTISLLIHGYRAAGDGLDKVDQTLFGLTPRTIALSKFVGKLRGTAESAADVVQHTAEAGIDQKMLESLPDAFSARIQEAVMSCQPSPPTTWPSSLLRLVGREDLDMASAREHEWKHSQPLIVEPVRDVRSICQLAEQPPSLLNTHPEHDRLQTSRLIFSQDRRYIEAMKLLDPTRQNVVECIPDPSWSEAEYLDAQKGIMQWVMLRTFALPPGNSMMHFNVRRPLPTEKYQLHGFSTSCLMKPMNNIVTADRSSFTEEKFGWAFFHAGVNHGLNISKDAKGIDTSWIVFNKPAELTNKHAGLLLGLGLNGHLKKLAKWLAFKYLTTKHTMTTVGLLLGFSASYLGTMDTLVTRMISIHVTRMLPLGAAELNNSPLVQTTGLMGIGLLYCNTQHRRMSEIMLSEIEHVELTDPSEPPDSLRDECYRLSAGFALGFINIGKGKDLRGLHDMRLVERLLAVAAGTKPVDIVHIIDQATAGATIALALIFMKTHDKAVAQKIDVPDTLPQFDYVRPDIFLLRTLAKHLIMWDDIRPNYRWVVRNLPPAYAGDYTLKGIKRLRSEHMPFYNILGGLLWSIGLKYAGSGEIAVRDFLVKYLDQFIRICRLPAWRYDSKLTRNTVRNCQDLVALAAATVMAGTGDLDVFRRLRSLHGRIGPSSDVPYGSHLASHFAIGALFMAGGTYTFGTSDLAVAALVCAFYPLFPMDVLDNKPHLQAFRHLWVLAAEPRRIVVRDVDTQRAITLPIKVYMSDGTERSFTAPCLLPELDTISMIRTASPEYWQITLDFANNESHLRTFRATQTIQVRRRPSREAHSSLFSATLASLNASATTSSASPSLSAGGLKFDWLFRLPAFADLDKADWEMVLPHDNNSSVSLDMRSTVVDTRMVLRRLAQGNTRDELMGLKVLFSWAEKTMRESRGKEPKWVGLDLIDKLRKEVLERGRAIGEEL